MALKFQKFTKIKIPKGKTYKGFDFSKFSKPVKFPKTKKVAIIKRAVKKLK